MRKIIVYCQGSQTPTTFKFNQPEGCNKVYNAYKNLDDEFEISDITSLIVYGFDNIEVQDEFESFKNTLPKYLQKYIRLGSFSTWLGEDGYTDNSKSEPCIEVRVGTRHDLKDNKIKKVKRLFDETVKFFTTK